MANLLMMGAMGLAVAEDPIVIMEDIFMDVHLEGQQTDMASPEVAEG